MVTSKSYPAPYLVWLVVPLVPFYLAFEYSFPGVGIIWQLTNGSLMILWLVLFSKKCENNVTLFLLAAIVFSLISTIFRGRVDLNDLAFVYKLLLIWLVLQVGWQYGKNYPDIYRTIYRASALGLVIAALSQAVGLYIGIEPEDQSYSGAAVGVSSSVALFSSYLCTVGYILITTSKNYISRLGWFGLSVFQIIFTFRRTALLSFVLQILTSVFARGVGFFVGFLFLSSALLFLLFGLLPSEFAGGAFTRILQIFSGEDTGSGRDLFYALAFNRLISCIDSECLFGIGKDGVVSLMFKDFGAEIGSHSLFLDVGLQFGWPALLILVLFFIKLFVSLVKNLRNNDPDSLGLGLSVSLLIFSLLSGVGVEPAVLPAYLAIGVVLGRASSHVK